MTPLEVYRLFTSQNGIQLHRDTLEYIHKEVPEDSIHKCIIEILKESDGKIVTVDHIKRILLLPTENKSRVDLESMKYLPGAPSRYSLLRQKILLKKTSIATVKLGIPAVVYGMINVSGTEIEIEDEDGSLRLNLKEIQEEEYLLARGVCLAVSGVLQKDGYFLVHQIHLPLALPAKKQQNKAEIPTGIVFISRYTSTEPNLNRLKYILEGYTAAEIPISSVVIMIEDKPIEGAIHRLSKVAKAYPMIEFVVIPGRIDEYFYPYGDCQSKENISTSTNPSALTVNGETFLLGRFDLIDTVKIESIQTNEFRENLIKTMLTQDSFNPFITYTDLSYTKPYKGIVIGDKYDCFTGEYNNHVLGVCGAFEKNNGQFLFYDGDTIEVCTLDQSGREWDRDIDTDVFTELPKSTMNNEVIHATHSSK
ncbi:hypothetical protein NEOKW01_1795 [Nematocida sp. AWRm80]|nr:hypothetical protein NEOKW01_1795 [Nematocida sp. AWRm80]